DWVLGHISKDEQRELQPALVAAVDAVTFWLANGIDKTMNAFNGGPAAGKEPLSPREPPTHAALSSPAPAEPPTPARPRPPLPGLGGQIAALRDQLRGKRTSEAASPAEDGDS
ncbi:MAG TPA: hypothetical protein VM536_15230, partial [Chloroflexia bacterium]|nr:hypothetical protein [Chloroflexia bacterium]